MDSRKLFGGVEGYLDLIIFKLNLILACHFVPFSFTDKIWYYRSLKCQYNNNNNY